MRYISMVSIGVALLLGLVGSGASLAVAKPPASPCGSASTTIQWQGQALCQYQLYAGDEVLPIYRSVRCQNVPNRFYVLFGWRAITAPNPWLNISWMPVRIHRSQIAVVRGTDGKFYVATQTLDLWRIAGVWISRLEFHLYRHGLAQRQIKATFGLNVDYYTECG